MEYFKKRKMYELARKLGYTGMPLYEDCDYYFHDGYEALNFRLDSGNPVCLAFVRPRNCFVVREMSIADYYETIRDEVIPEKEFYDIYDISADMPLYIAKN